MNANEEPTTPSTHFEANLPKQPKGDTEKPERDRKEQQIIEHALQEQRIRYGSPSPQERKHMNTLIVAGSIVLAGIIAVTILGIMLLGLANSTLDPEDSPIPQNHATTSPINMV